MNSKRREEVKRRRGKSTSMNNYQRLVLSVGAIALCLVLWTSPMVVIVEGVYLSPEARKDLIPIIEPRTASIRVGGVLGATLLIFFALKNYRPKKDEEEKVDHQEILPKLELKVDLQEILPKSEEKVMDPQEMLSKLDEKVADIEKIFIKSGEKENAEKTF